MGREDILNRIVVQIYDTEMLNTVKQIYPFTNWIYTLYQTPNPNYDEIAVFFVPIMALICYLQLIMK